MDITDNAAKKDKFLQGVLGSAPVVMQAAELSPPAPYYGVLIIARERLEAVTTCDIGIYLQDRLAAPFRDLVEKIEAAISIARARGSFQPSTVCRAVLACSRLAVFRKSSVFATRACNSS